MKKYYWLKLKNDFFKSRSMKKLRKIAGGDTYTIIYLKLQLLSLQNNGDLHFEGVEENLLEELALDIDESVENVQATMFFLEKCGLVTDVSPEKVSLPEVKENTGTETSSAERVRKHREKKKQLAIGVNEGQKVLQSNKEVTKCNTEIEKEKELELKKEKKIDKENINISVFDSALNDFYDMRKKIKAPMTDRAKKLLVNQLNKLAPDNQDVQIQILEQSIINSWKSVYALKGPEKKFEQLSVFGNKPQQSTFGSKTIHKADLDEEMKDW